MKLNSFFEDMTVFRDKTAGARSVFTPYGSASLALEGENSDRKISLNGIWRFGYYTSYLKIPEKILQKTTDLSVFSEVKLPATVKSLLPDMENAGLDVPFDPPYIPPDSPAGVFIRDFEFSENSDPYRKYLVFEGVSSCVYLYINGQYVGFAEVSSAMQEFDITDFLTQGKNRICAVVLKYCDGSYIENTDEALFGIYSDTYILLRPKGHIRDFMASTSLSEDCTKGYIDLKIDAVIYSSLTAELYSPDGELIDSLSPDSDGNLRFCVDNPRFYSAENPLLYTFILGFGGEYIPQKVGIRELKWDKSGLLYNKKRITLKPVVYGRILKNDGAPLSKKDYFADLSRLKQHSVNTVIIKNRPLPVCFYELCDELGFYLLDTADIDASLFEEHFPDTLCESNEWEGALYNRVNLLTARDKNFSSILAWNLHPSVKSGKNIFFVAERVRRLDKMRTVRYGTEGRGGFPLELIDFNSLYSFDGSFEKPLSVKIKQLYKPISVFALDKEKGRFEITNNLDFSYISGIEVFYELSEFGKIQSTNSLGILTLAPKKSAEINLDITLPANADSSLKFYYKNIFASPCIPDNFTLGFDAFEIDRPYRQTEKTLSQTPLTLTETDFSYEISGQGFKMTFDKTKGILCDIYRKDVLVCEKVMPSCYLAEGGSPLSYDERIILRDCEAVYDKKTHQAEISAVCVLAEKGKPHHIQFNFRYTVNRAGEVTLKYTFTRDNEIEGVKRIGFDFYLPKDKDTAEYYALCPASFIGETQFGYMGRQKETVKTCDTVSHKMRARFVSVYDRLRNGIIVYKKQNEVSFFVNGKSQHEIAGDLPASSNVLSVNTLIDTATLPSSNHKGELSFRPINADDGSLWGNATAVYKS